MHMFFNMGKQVESM